MFNDLGLGSYIDACIITAAHTEVLRSIETLNERAQKGRSCVFRKGTTAWNTENIKSRIGMSWWVLPI